MTENREIGPDPELASDFEAWLATKRPRVRMVMQSYGPGTTIFWRGKRHWVVGVAELQSGEAILRLSDLDPTETGTEFAFENSQPVSWEALGIWPPYKAS